MPLKHWLDPDDNKSSFYEIEQEFESMGQAMAHLNENVGRIATLLEKKVNEIQSDLKAWRQDVDLWRKSTDKQLQDIHHCRTDHQKLLDSLEHHVKNSKPIDHYLGKWALGLVMFVATIAGSYVINQILQTNK